MSRCFPYPPPGYSRNGATYEALIESIKLQKETDKSKAERKKHKKSKKDKKEKEKRKDGEKVKKSQKNPDEYKQDSCKVLQSSKEINNEVLEKSDLSEEHGQPISQHNPSYSSDSTQNSNKRKRDEPETIVPDGTSAHGKPFKIRLLKKSDSSKETLSSNSGRTDTADPKINTWKISTSRSVPSVSNSVNGVHGEDRRKPSLVPATSGRENSAVQGNLIQSKPNSSSEKPQIQIQQGVRLSRKPSPSPGSVRPIPPSNQLKHESPRPIPPSNQLKHETQRIISPSNQLKQEAPPSSVRPIPPSNQLKHGIPASVSNKPVPQSSSQLSNKSERPILPTNHLKPEIPRPTLNNNTVQGVPSTTGKRPISETANNSRKEPKVELSRAEKKLKKKHSKYEKLIGSWVPPVVEALKVPGGGGDGDDDQDWLCRSEKRVGSRKCDVEVGHELGGDLLWQPCARFLAEADIHALPYTVPF